MAKPSRSAGDAGESVFLNLPYDPSFERLFLAYIAGLCSLGLFPRAALEVQGGQSRLDLIADHDLTPVVSKRVSPPRLNMAFELGLTVAAKRERRSGHDWFVFEAKRERLRRTLSDIAGTDGYFHGRRPSGIFRELGNAFARVDQPSVEQMEDIFDSLVLGLPKLQKAAGASSPFTPRVFRDLRALARELYKTARA